jgi:hypothetical protein
MMEIQLAAHAAIYAQSTAMFIPGPPRGGSIIFSLSNWYFWPRQNQRIARAAIARGFP